MPRDNRRSTNVLDLDGVQSKWRAERRVGETTPAHVTRETRPASHRFSIVSLLPWLLLLGGATAVPSSAGAQRLVEQKDKAHPRVQYDDSLISVNDRCIVRQGRLSPGYEAVYVNGRPIGFC